MGRRIAGVGVAVLGSVAALGSAVRTMSPTQGSGWRPGAPPRVRVSPPVGRDEVREKVAQVLSEFAADGGRVRRSAYLLPVLQRVQRTLGYIPQEAVPQIAEFLQVPASRIRWRTRHLPMTRPLRRNWYIRRRLP